MNTIKIIGADWDLVASPKRAENEEKSWDNYEGGELPQLCGCCGKVIKNYKEAKSLRIIDGGNYFTEFEGEVEECADMGWWYVGSDCYRKYTKNKREIEVSW